MEGRSGEIGEIGQIGEIGRIRYRWDGLDWSGSTDGTFVRYVAAVPNAILQASIVSLKARLYQALA